MIRSMIKTAASPSACHSPFSIMSSCLEWCRADFLLLTWLRQCFALFLCFSDARVTRVIVYMTINVEMIGTSVRDAKEVNSTCDLAGAFRLRYGSCVPRVCWVLITIRGGSALPLTLYSGLWSEGIHTWAISKVLNVIKMNEEQNLPVSICLVPTGRQGRACNGAYLR